MATRNFEPLTEITMTEQKPNPYNAAKEWHTEDGPAVNSANSLFNAKPSNVEVSPDPTDNVATQGVDYKKRYDDLKTHYDRKINEFNQKLTQIEAKAVVETQATVNNEAANRVSTFEQENPNVAEAVRDITNQQNAELKQQLEEVTKRELDARKLEAKRILVARHADFTEIAQDIGFQNWTAEQPKAIQDWILNNPYDGELAARAIDLYKQDKGIQSPVVEETRTPRQPNQDAANLVPTRSAGANTPPDKKIWTRAEIKAMTPAQYDKFEQEIDQAIVEGRVAA